MSFGRVITIDVDASHSPANIIEQSKLSGYAKNIKPFKSHRSKEYSK